MCLGIADPDGRLQAPLLQQDEREFGRLLPHGTARRVPTARRLIPRKLPFTPRSVWSAAPARRAGRVRSLPTARYILRVQPTSSVISEFRLNTRKFSRALQRTAIPPILREIARFAFVSHEGTAHDSPVA